jgi:hypothetical protein
MNSVNTMPNRISKHKVLAQLCIVTSWGTWVKARGLKDRNHFTQRLVRQATYVRLQTQATGRDSTVGLATCYWLDGPGIESRWEVRFSLPIQPGPGAHPASNTVGTGSFPQVKRPGRGVDHPPPSSTELKKSTAIYLLPLWAFVVWPLPLTFTNTSRWL